MKRKRIEVWGWLTNDGIPVSHQFYGSKDEAQRHTPFMHLSSAYRLERLVEHNPRADAVVRAARKFLDGTTGSSHLRNNLERAVARLDAKPRGKR